MVIWRREDYADVLLQSGVTAVLLYLKELSTAAAAPGAPAEARAEALYLAERLVGFWLAKAPGPYSGQPGKRDEMLRLLKQLGNAELLARFIAEVVINRYDGSENAALVAGAELLGPADTGRLFSELVTEYLAGWSGKCMSLLDALAASPDLANAPEWSAARRQIARAAVEQLAKFGRPIPGAMPLPPGDRSRVVDSDPVADLLDVLARMALPALRAAAVKSFIARPEMFDPVTTLTPALAETLAWDDAVTSLWHHAVEFVLRRSGQPPALPADWRQEVKLTCKCAECRELQLFALNPAVQGHCFRLREEHRSHLEREIQRHQLDMQCVTELQGSPKTLVVTKDRRSFRRQCVQYRQDIDALGVLIEQTRKNPALKPTSGSASPPPAAWRPTGRGCKQ